MRARRALVEGGAGVHLADGRVDNERIAGRGVLEAGRRDDFTKARAGGHAVSVATQRSRSWPDADVGLSVA